MVCNGLFFTVSFSNSLHICIEECVSVVPAYMLNHHSICGSDIKVVSSAYLRLLILTALDRDKILDFVVTLLYTHHRISFV